MESLFSDTRTPPQPKSSKIVRRWRQIEQAVCCLDFSASTALATAVDRHYSHPEEVRFYKKVQTAGLFPNEVEALQKSLQLSRHEIRHVCVVGCGTGRELLAIQEQIPSAQFVGLDQSSAMILAASDRRDSRIQWTSQPMTNLRLKFDLIWITALLESHIQGRSRRLAFFSEVRNQLKPNGLAVFNPMIRPLHFRSPLYWASQLLRWRWLFSEIRWEKGDSLVANLGNHRALERLVFLHHYPSAQDFQNELLAAGFREMTLLPQQAWVVS